MTRSRRATPKGTGIGAKAPPAEAGAAQGGLSAAGRTVAELAGLRRRLAAMLYESMLLLGVLALSFLGSSAGAALHPMLAVAFSAIALLELLAPLLTRWALGYSGDIAPGPVSRTTGGSA